MANLARVRVRWSGTTIVGPGVSTFYFDEAGEGWTAALDTFFGAIITRIAAGTTITTPGVGELVDAATGDITGTWSEGADQVHTAGASASYVAGVGGRVTWHTTARTNNRPVRGTTFLVPLTTSQFGAAGRVDAGAVSSIQTAVNALYTAVGSDLRIWTRPKSGAGGAAHAVTSGTMEGAVAWLRTRKT